MKEILGYKCFDKHMKNIYGIKFETGITYIDKYKPQFGNNGHGFHMCKRIEDTLRYFNGLTEEVNICLVKGSGQMAIGFDDYNEYYDMYSVEKLEIIKILDRKEIMNIVLNLDEERVKRFIMGFKLTEKEIEIFKNQFKNYDKVLAYIEYYQEQIEESFSKRLEKLNYKRK